MSEARFGASSPPLASSGMGIGMAAAMAVATLGSFGTVFTLWRGSRPPSTAYALRVALEEYNAGNLNTARRLAERVDDDLSAAPEEASLRAFLLGATRVVAARRDAEDRQRRLELHLALHHLLEASRGGFPPGRTTEGHRLMAEAMQALGKFDQAAERWEKVLAAEPVRAREVLGPLAQCQFRGQAASPGEALRSVEKLLAMPNLSPAEVTEATLLKARILTEMERFNEAETTLDALADTPATEPHRQLQRAELLVRRAAAGPETLAAPRFEEALEILSELRRTGAPETQLAARLAAGRAFRQMGAREEALGMLAAMRQNRQFRAEAIAAGVDELELLAELGYSDEVLQTVDFIVREIGDPRTFDPRWLSLDELRQRALAVAEQLRHAGDYATVISMARRLPPVFDLADTMRLEGTGYRAWGAELLERGRRPDGSVDPRREAEAREHFRLAGDAFYAAASQRFTEPMYPQWLWEAIDAYQRGRYFTHSLELLDDYLRYERRERSARGLLARGRALLALGRAAEAVDPLDACASQFPRDPLRYEASLVAALAHAEIGETESAEQLLESNLLDGRLAPSSPVWRDSLYALGELLFRDGLHGYLDAIAPGLGRPGAGDERLQANQERLEAAARRMEEAMQRDEEYGNLRRARRAAYLAAEARRMAAYWPGQQADNPETLDSVRRQMNVLRLEHLRAALAGFRSLRDRLNLADEQSLLGDAELAMLRNCYLAEGDTLLAMGQLEEAERAYQNATHRFLNQPPCLEALLQQAQIYERLGRHEEARRVIQQAAQVLDRVPDELDSQFARITRYDRDHWVRLLQWLETS